MAWTTVDDVVDGIPLVPKSYDDAFQSYGVTVPKMVLNEQRGRDKWTVIQELGGESAEEIFAFFNNILLENADRVEEIEGVSSVFRFLRDHGIRVALSTGFPRGIAERTLGHIGWEEKDMIDGWTCSEAVGKSRPDPAMIHALMGRLGVEDPGKAMKIDDTAKGIEEGLIAGAATLSALTGTQTRERLLQAGPHGIIRSVRNRRARRTSLKL